MADTTPCVLPTPLLLSQLKLGSLVPSPSNPHQNTQLPLTLFLDTDYTVAPITRAFNLTTTPNSDFALRLTRLLHKGGISWTGSTVTALEGNRYDLTTPHAWFRRLCDDVGVRDWLRARLGEADTAEVFLLVGLETVTVARYGEDVVGSAAVLPENKEGSAVVGPATNEKVHTVYYKTVEVRWRERDGVRMASLDEDLFVDLTSEEARDEEILVATLTDDLCMAGEFVCDEASPGEDVYAFLRGDEDEEGE